MSRLLRKRKRSIASDAAIGGARGGGSRSPLHAAKRARLDITQEWAGPKGAASKSAAQCVDDQKASSSVTNAVNVIRAVTSPPAANTPPPLESAQDRTLQRSDTADAEQAFDSGRYGSTGTDEEALTQEIDEWDSRTMSEEALASLARDASGTASGHWLSSGKRTYRVDPHIRQLNEDGRATRAPVLELVRSRRTASLMNQLVREEERLREQQMRTGMEVATEILRLLKEYFHPLDDYEYEYHKPSHSWASVMISPEHYHGRVKGGRRTASGNLTRRGVRTTPRKLFRNLLDELVTEAQAYVERDEMLLHLPSPCYVLGDLHGNYKDLMWFASSFWRMGVEMCPARLLFLGDYVDRGPHGVETMAYLLALKILHPTRVFLLRGNHELPAQNGGALYGVRSLKEQCIELFRENKRRGIQLWELFNLCFDYLPLACTIDERVFCCHGGLPRALSSNADVKSPPFSPRTSPAYRGLSNVGILDRIGAIQRPLAEQAIEDATEENDFVALDLLWADPAGESDEVKCDLAQSVRERMKKKGKVLAPAIEERHALVAGGFMPNEMRGGDTIMFGNAAVDEFVKQTGLTHLIRAHQPPEMGIEFAKGARIITVFSSSHYCGRHNSAAVVLVSEGKIRVATTAHDAPEEALSQYSTPEEEVSVFRSAT